MTLRATSCAWIAAVGVCLAQGASPAAVDELLRAVGQYVASYERELRLVIAEEKYTQVERPLADPDPTISATRVLRSDLLTVSDGSGGWVSFRDVYEVDGSPVRDRTQRLAKLFLEPHDDRLAQARRIAEEGTRFNLSRHISRTINFPLLVLQFVRPQNQVRSDFKIDGTTRVNGVQAAILSFKEHATPRMIRTVDEAPARGRFWIDPTSGRVLRTEFFIETRPPLPKGGRASLTTLIQVEYADQPAFGIWLPVSMQERYVGGRAVEGAATYSNFRRFNVTTEEIIKAP
jgi:hypothetical protein